MYAESNFSSIPTTVNGLGSGRFWNTPFSACPGSASNLNHLPLSLKYNQGDLCSRAEGGYLGCCFKNRCWETGGEPRRKWRHISFVIQILPPGRV